MKKNIKIMIVTHKPVKLIKNEYFYPINAGRDVAKDLSKDGKISNTDYEWLINNTHGDNTGDNISSKNRYYSEVSALYWAWKNYDKLGSPYYIGLMHYRRFFIFNESYYITHKKNKWEEALSYVSENFINDDFIRNIGLTEDIIEKACDNYDIIVSKNSNLKLIHGRNIRDDYKNTISGAKIEDFDLMIEIIKEKYPEYLENIDILNGYEKNMYQMFIMKKDLFFEYSEFLFGVLREIENQVDFNDYSLNGKRSLGYLAEILQTIFVNKLNSDSKIRILKCGVAMVKYPHEDTQIKEILEKKAPKYSDYLKQKVKSLFLKGVDKQKNKELYQGIRTKRRDYLTLKKLYIQKGQING